MSQTEISIRQWQERFKAGAFDSPDLDTQCRAGWYDWFCQDRALAGRLKKIAKVVMGIASPFILDNYQDQQDGGLFGEDFPGLE